MKVKKLAMGLFSLVGIASVLRNANGIVLKAMLANASKISEVAHGIALGAVPLGNRTVSGVFGIVIGYSEMFVLMATFPLLTCGLISLVLLIIRTISSSTSSRKKIKKKK